MRVPQCAAHAPGFAEKFAFPDLRANAQLEFRHEHRPAELVLTQNPFKAPYQRLARFTYPVALRAFQQRRRHSKLVDRVDLVKIENAALVSVQKPGPLALRSL